MFRYPPYLFLVGEPYISSAAFPFLEAPSSPSLPFWEPYLVLVRNPTVGDPL